MAEEDTLTSNRIMDMLNSILQDENTRNNMFAEAMNFVENGPDEVKDIFSQVLGCSGKDDLVEKIKLINDNRRTKSNYGVKSWLDGNRNVLIPGIKILLTLSGMYYSTDVLWLIIAHEIFTMITK